MFVFGLPPRDPGVYPRVEYGLRVPVRGHPLVGPGLTPAAGPAVRRHGWTALMLAASKDDRAIVAALLGARADVNPQKNDGCAFAAGAVRRVVGGGRR